MQHRIALSSLIAAAILFVSMLRGAGSNAAEEVAIRKIIASAPSGRLAYVADVIEWSGATLRPVVGKDQPAFSPGAGSVPNRVPGSTKATDSPIRIVVADSRDLAYEYGKGTVEYDLKGGKPVKFETGYLRVWQKQAGAWKVAAQFTRPLDTETVPVVQQGNARQGQR
jgi:hypothetical protein